MSYSDIFDPAQQEWMRNAGVQSVFAAIRDNGGEVRFVGGCVRDALLGRDVGEIDLAVNMAPDRVADSLIKAGLKVAPTGIEHGTVTAIADHTGYEITTLRRDVETFGRHAKVEFTDDWQADAARRDFTINALYADLNGTIYDYFDGRGDLMRGQVRFIGDAADRIREDVLRILRFFRFYAWFGRGAADADGLAACRELAPMLPKLSAERVWREVNKLLNADNPLTSWRLLTAYKVLPHFLPDAGNLARLEHLLEVEKKFDARTLSITRLAALLPSDGAAEIAKKLKMSNREAEQLKTLAELPVALHGKLDPLPFRRALYRYGADAAREAALLCAADDLSADLQPALDEAAKWRKPVFPLQGGDILKLGLQPGPRVGEILRSVEDWWAARDFRPARDECLLEARKLAE